MRKFVIGFVSLCAVLGLYLLNKHLNSSPPLDADQQTNIIESSSDSNAVSFDSNIGKIGDIGVGTTKKAYFTKLNKITKEIEQEWGFEKVLSETRDIWDVEKPYTNILRHNFKCYITADKGKVQVETAVGRTTPKDATFTSNVVVRILSGPPDDVKDSFLYLDNFIFLSEKSRLSTADPCDPVKFVSEDIQMEGKGLVLVYNEPTGRLEYFEINDLESLNIKGALAASFSTENASKENGQNKIEKPGEQHVKSDIPKAEAPINEVRPQDEQKEGVNYKCTFRRNVLVNTPDELIFVGNKLCVNNIFWAKSSKEQPTEVDANSVKDGETVAENAKQGSPAADVVSEQKITTPDSTEPNVTSEQPKSIVITCDGGFVVLPEDSVRAQKDDTENESENNISAIQLPGEFDDQTGKTRFLTQRIDYNYTTGDGIINGPSELTFYASSTSGTDSNEATIPVKVTTRKRAYFSQTSRKMVFTDCLVTRPQSGLTESKDITLAAPEITVNLPKDKSQKPDMFAIGPAELVFYMQDANDPNIYAEPIPVTVNAQKQAQFLAASNQIVFEGDCNCIMLKENPNTLIKYILLSDQITIDLPADSNESLSEPTANIKHLTATGKVVRLAMTKRPKNKSASAGQIQEANSVKPVSGVELKCRRVDYDAVREELLATGPGVIKFNNSETPDTNEQVGQFSMKKPCVVVMEGFDTLQYLIRENRIVADAGPEEKVQMNYFPVIDGRIRLDENIEAEASHIVALLYKLPEGQTELSMLTATGGIKYTDKGKEFMGSELFYDHKTAILKVNGDETHPCYFNGALVDGIEMNVETNEVKANLVEPGTLQINR